MKIFISWSGVTSFAVAEALHDWLPTVIKAVKPWMSSDIDRGKRWILELATQLEKSRLAIVCLTPDNLGAPWLLFESGASFKGIDTNLVCPYLFQLAPTDITGPLAQFQTTCTNEKDTEKLLQTINQTLSKQALSKALLKANFNRRWPQLRSLLNRINRRSPLQQTKGKNWTKTKIIKETIRCYLASSVTMPTLTIRLISYTGETTYKVLACLISKLLSPGTKLNIRILLRSKYAGFASRPEDHAFNQHIRWRISRTETRWYRWFRKHTDKHNGANNIQLEIRGYTCEPASKAVILENYEAFFGVYQTLLHPMSNHDEISPAIDWVADETTMAHIDRQNQSFLNNLVTWFDQKWESSTGKLTDGYRCEISDLLLQLCKEKSKMDKDIVRLLKRWIPDGHAPEIGNLALPAFYPERTLNLIDFMASAVVFNDTGRSILVCEIRQPGETWEGIGKTATCLDLIGIEPQQQQTGNPFWKIKSTGNKCLLFSTDFVWLWQENGRLFITRPEGEPIWGLWDCARYLLRTSTENYQPGFQRTKRGRDIQEKFFLKLPLSPLAKRYSQQHMIEPSVIIILCPGQKKLAIERVEDHKTIRKLLTKAIQSAPNHPSRFWKREKHEVQQHNNQASQIVNSLLPKQMPKVYHVSGAISFGSIAPLIRKYIIPLEN